MAAGAVVKKTKITDEFSYNDFQNQHGQNALLLFVIDDAKKLLISTAEEPLRPESGQTVIALVDPRPEAKTTGSDPGSS